MDKEILKDIKCLITIKEKIKLLHTENTKLKINVEKYAILLREAHIS